MNLAFSQRRNNIMTLYSKSKTEQMENYDKVNTVMVSYDCSIQYNKFTLERIESSVTMVHLLLQYANRLDGRQKYES